MKKIVTGLAAAALAALAIFLVVRWLESEETRIRRMIGGLEDSIESRSTLSFMEHVHLDFKATGRGRTISYDLLKAAAFTTFRNFKVIDLEITDPRVTVDPGEETATASFSCRMLVRSTEAAAPEDFSAVVLGGQLIVLKLKKESGRWVVIEAEFGPDAKVPSTTDAN